MGKSDWWIVWHSRSWYEPDDYLARYDTRKQAREHMRMLREEARSEGTATRSLDWGDYLYIGSDSVAIERTARP